MISNYLTIQLKKIVGIHSHNQRCNEAKNYIIYFILVIVKNIY
jgi:hypothetical protein